MLSSYTHVHRFYLIMQEGFKKNLRNWICNFASFFVEEETSPLSFECMTHLQNDYDTVIGLLKIRLHTAINCADLWFRCMVRIEA